MDLLRALPARLVDPVLVVLLLWGAGALLIRRARRREAGHEPPKAGLRRGGALGVALAAAAWLLLWILATPRIASALTRAVEARPTDLGAALASVPVDRRALVVLTGGIRAPDSRSAPAMERLTGTTPSRAIGAARIYREQGFGLVIVSGSGGGDFPDDAARGIADLMIALGVPKERIQLETQSLDTKQSARYVAELVANMAVDRVAVTSTATHVPRAVWEFRRAGLDVVAAPVDFEPPPPTGPLAWLPNAGSLLYSAKALHEVLGRLKP